MERILDVAQFLFDEYHRVTGETIDEMKLHKLLYFAQRESFAVSGQPLFSEELQGWKYGPVSPDVRPLLGQDGIEAATHPVGANTAYLLKNVILEYAPFASWKLSELTHQEQSWRNARAGLSPQDAGSRPLLLEDIRQDAKKVRPYDHVWDMYYDEFEDLEVTGT